MLKKNYGTIDKMLLYVTLVILAIGLVMVFSASSYEAMITYKNSLLKGSSGGLWPVWWRWR